LPDSSEEKTEKPTAKRRSDQRKEGNVFQSKEVIIAATLIATFASLRFLYPLTENILSDSMRSFLSLVGTMDSIKKSDMYSIFIDGIISVAIGTGPIILIAAVIAVIAAIAQTRGLVSFKSIRPKFSRMNPLNGIKNLFSLKGIIELLKSIIKIVVLFAVIYLTLKDELTKFPKLMDMDIAGVTSAVGGIIWNISFKVIIAFVVVAAFDYMYQRWDYEKKLKMTKQEVKEEYKMTEGDPKVKGKIKSKQQQMSRQRMMQAVPEADVVIRNPTHFAVALKYDHEKNNAPVIVAKGEDYMALKIIEIAEEHDIPILENKPLARALYSEVDLDREIPSEFYAPVAEVLASVYSL